MAKLTDRTELTTPADGDLYVTTDVSDTTDAASGTDKKITWANIKAGLKTYFDTLYAAALGADDNYVTDAEKAALHSHSNKAVLDATTASFTTADETKLDGIEAGADVTDTANVTAAGALMDSEVTNLAAVKAFNPADYTPVQVVVSGSLTAVLNTFYNNVASATYTDPSPTEGKGFFVFVRNGTATVGGTGYSTSGTIIHRIYHSGAWTNYIYATSSTLISDTAYGVGWNGSTTTAPSQNAVYDEIELRAPKSAPTLTGTTTADRLDYDRAVGGVNAIGNLGATETIDWSTHTHYTGTLDSNITFTYSNQVSGQSVTLYLTYDGTAQRTITWPTTTWLDNDTGAAPTTPSASGKVLVVTLSYIGTTTYASATGNYAVYA